VVDVETDDQARPKAILLRRVGVGVLVVSIVGSLTFVVLTYRWFVAPSTVSPERADAVVALAGGAGERLPKALELMNQGVADTLILNEGVDWHLPESEPVHELCQSGSTAFEVICVKALPDSTRGEAITISAVAEERGFTSLALVTTDHHLSRSTRWFRRCFDGEIYPVAAPARTSRADVKHEWLGVLDQLIVNRSCGEADTGD
jgi:uncharacterized SAM-binding protein YcdF (DUF218 family)